MTINQKIFTICLNCNSRKCPNIIIFLTDSLAVPVNRHSSLKTWKFRTYPYPSPLPLIFVTVINVTFSLTRRPCHKRWKEDTVGRKVYIVVLNGHNHYHWVPQWRLAVWGLHTWKYSSSLIHFYSGIRRIKARTGFEVDVCHGHHYSAEDRFERPSSLFGFVSHSILILGGVRQVRVCGVEVHHLHPLRRMCVW